MNRRTTLLSAVASVLDKFAEDAENEDAEEGKSPKEDKKDAKGRSDAPDDEGNNDGPGDEKEASELITELLGRAPGRGTIQKIAHDPELFEALRNRVDDSRTPPRMGGPSTKNAEADERPLTKAERMKAAWDQYGESITK